MGERIDGYMCPKCEGENIRKVTGAKVLECRECGHRAPQAQFIRLHNQRQAAKRTAWWMEFFGVKEGKG